MTEEQITTPVTFTLSVWSFDGVIQTTFPTFDEARTGMGDAINAGAWPCNVTIRSSALPTLGMVFGAHFGWEDDHETADAIIAGLEAKP
jgi:hypothetical protein